MYIEDLLKEKVQHKKYGSGVISSIDDPHIEVQFPQYGKVCRFVYPWCFDGFLRLENEKDQESVLVFIEQWKRENGISEKEAIRQRYEETQQKISARQEAVMERKIRSAQRAFKRKYNDQ